MNIDYKGKLWRALNPVHARAPLSGEGARLYGGRFNPKGMAALYLSLSVATALREANQVGSFQPTTLVCYDADIQRVFDGRNEAALAAQGLAPADLAHPGWRDAMQASGQASGKTSGQASGEAPTQTFARCLIAANYQGLLVRSFAPGAQSTDLNLVLWAWGNAPPSRLALIDDENRLS